jgi:hypothetical protein
LICREGFKNNFIKNNFSKKVKKIKIINIDQNDDVFEKDF